MNLKYILSSSIYKLIKNINKLWIKIRLFILTL